MQIHFVEQLLKDAVYNTATGCFMRHDLPPGSAAWCEHDREIRSILFTCPCGCKTVRTVPVKRSNAGPEWLWDGDRLKPTLTPSIQIIGECRWHGYLTKGEWLAA